MEQRKNLEYNEQLQQRLEALCGPFLKDLGLSFFVYKKFIKNVGIVYICNNPTWTQFRDKHCLWECETFKREALPLIPNVPKFYAWCEEQPLKDDHFYDALYNHNIWNGVSRYLLQGDTLEVVGFGATPQKTRCPLFYLENSGLLEYFIGYFKQQFLDVISGGDAFVPFPSQRIWSAMEGKETPDILADSPPCPFITGSQGQLVRLTPREADIAPYLAKGYTAKDIAYRLGLSSRTVESYINNIKMKTGLHFKSEIIAALNAVAV